MDSGLSIYLLLTWLGEGPGEGQMMVRWSGEGQISKDFLKELGELKTCFVGFVSTSHIHSTPGPRQLGIGKLLTAVAGQVRSVPPAQKDFLSKQIIFK